MNVLRQGCRKLSY